MAGYAIKVIYGPWSSREAITFDRANYLQWKDTIEPGTRVLIFRREPVGAIVAEAEVTGSFGLFEPVGSETLAASGTQEQGLPAPNRGLESIGRGNLLTRVDFTADDGASYLLPVRILRSGEHGLVTREKIREVTGIEDFPREDEQWLPIDEQVYLDLAGRFE